MPVNLAILVTLAIFAPHLMIVPGKTIDAHAEIAKDCFACHTPFLGSSPAKCISCHKVAEIGLKTTKGLPIAKEKKNVAFHQKLIEEDCVACHSDHKGVQAFRPIGQFSHKLLQPGLQEQCDSCHSGPGDALHLKIKGNCAAMPHAAGVVAGHLRARTVLSLRPAPRHRLRDLPRRQRLCELHLLRLPRALTLEDP